MGSDRANLRLTTPARSGRKGRGSGFHGVTYNKDQGQWVASIRIDDVDHELGCFDSEEEAANARDRAAVYYHRDLAVLNFPSADYGTGMSVETIRSQTSPPRKRPGRRRGMARRKAGVLVSTRGNMRVGGPMGHVLRAVEDGHDTRDKLVAHFSALSDSGEFRLEKVGSDSAGVRMPKLVRGYVSHLLRLGLLEEPDG